MLFSKMYGYMRKWMRDGQDGGWSLVDKKEAINIAQEEFNDEAPCIIDSAHFTVAPSYSATPTWQRKASVPTVRLYKDANRDDGVLEYYLEDTSAQNEVSLLITNVSRVDGDGAPDPGPSWQRRLIVISEPYLDDQVLRELEQQYSDYVLLFQPNRFQLWPPPGASDNSTVQVDFRGVPVELVNDTDTSLVPDEYHSSITHGATADLFERRGMYEEAQSHLRKFWDGVAQAKRKYRTKTAEPQPQISRTYYT